ncbi:hypothetical protein [Flavobacterium sp. WV_118_3]|uniref:hypothetical protein n=1 Tax=Flavobacterium sp. WV_118_3 TaxID=3151764 RepID=UPI00321B2C24
MLKELIPSFKKSIDERLSNPIIGTFTVAWLVCNWKIIFIILFSDKKIEEKIKYIELNYSNSDSLILFPLLFSFVYLLIFPWLLLGIQILQYRANGERKSNQLKTDTEYTTKKIALIDAELRVESLKLKYSLDNDMQKKSKEMELERDKSMYEFDIERDRRRLEFDYEEKKAEYEEQRKRRELEMTYESKMKELNYDERKTRNQLELERLKIGNEKLKENIDYRFPSDL